MRTIKPAATIIAVMTLTACHRGLLTPEPPTESELEARASRDTSVLLQRCAVEYARSHWTTTLSGTELAKASVFSCLKLSNEVYEHSLKSYMTNEDFKPRQIDGDQFAANARKQADDLAQSAVLQAIADGH